MSNHRASNSERRQRGFTLAEILVTTAIFAIIMIAALAVYDRSNRVFKTSTEAADLQQSTRIGFDKLVSDIRMAGFDYSRGGVPTGGVAPWQPSTAYSVAAVVDPGNGFTYTSTQAGTSGATAPIWSTVVGGNTSDNTVIWKTSTPSTQFPQPDEQVEYAGPTALVFRANFDYQTDAAHGNGLEDAEGYTPKAPNGTPIFPYVTTGNDEIVAYVMRSVDSTKNNGSISFYADVWPVPANPTAGPPARRAYPNIAGLTGGAAEPQITIGPATCGTCGIDTSNNNPPYTLYRVTADDVMNGRMGTPVAENIRSVNFTYYSDATGQTLLTNPDGTPIATGRDAGGGTFTAANTGAIGGDGQYDPNNVGAAANFADRTQRALIQSVRVDLVGMNANADLGGYTHPTETIAAIKNYRQYSLSSLVAPRNLGLTGFAEPSYNPPGPPTITGMCTGHCGAPVIYWTPPSGGGPVIKFHAEWDTNPNGAFTTGVDINDPTATSYILPDVNTNDDVSQVHYYRMTATNDNGTSVPSAQYQVTPTNTTRPNPPGPLAATTGQTNTITLTWTGPTNNTAAKQTLSCSGMGGSTNGAAIPTQGQEHLLYSVYRGENINFDPTSTTPGVDTGVKILDSWDPGLTPGASLTWVDSAAAISGQPTTLYPPASCVQYYYRVRAKDRCSRQASWNASGSTADSISGFSPAVGSNAAAGQSTASAAPKVLPSLTIDRTTLNATGCPDPQNPTSPNCRVTLNWTKVSTDTTNTPIGVDTYMITRAWRLQQAGGAYVTDVLFGPNGQLEANCSTGNCTSSGSSYTQQTAPPPGVGAAGTASYADTPPFLNNGGQVLEYQYTVAAKSCSLYSGNAPNTAVEAGMLPNLQVAFPGCSINPAIVQAGATNPSGTGDTPAQAWIFNGGDTVTVTPPSGTNVTDVVFNLFMWPQGTPVPAMTQTVNPPGNSTPPGGYVFVYSDQIDNQIYELRITINTVDAQGNPCQEVHVKYIQDQPAAPCAFSNVTPPSPAVAGHGNNPETDAVTFTVTNNGTDPMLFNIVGLFTGSINLTWHSPDLPDHTDLQLTDIVWGVPSALYSNTDAICGYGVNCVPTGSGTSVTTRNAPSSFPIAGVPAGKTLTITIRFKFNGTGSRPSLPPTPSAITKLCLSYRIVSEPGVTKKCNLVGQAVTTANPTNCD